MNINELRISNYVSPAEDSTVFQVEGIGIFEFYLINDEKSLWIEKYSIKGIDINEEWLLKFGFKRIEETCGDDIDIKYELERDNFYFNYSDDWSIAIADNKRVYEYTSNYLTLPINRTNKVHLLQNLYFYLSGEELEIIK